MTTNPYLVQRPGAGAAPQGLADLLERVLDKGVVIAGDIQVNLLDIELLTIKVRLLIASADTAQQMGIDWWQHDPFLSSKARELEAENAELRQQIEQLDAGSGQRETSPVDGPPPRPRRAGGEQGGDVG